MSVPSDWLVDLGHSRIKWAQAHRGCLIAGTDGACALEQVDALDRALAGHRRQRLWLSGQSNPEAVCEYVRQRLGFQLLAPLRREDGTVPLIQLAPEWEDVFATHQIAGDRGATDVALPPDAFAKLAGGISERLAEAGANGASPALVTSSRRRRFLRTVLAARGLRAPVLSFEELGVEARPALLGTVAA